MVRTSRTRSVVAAAAALVAAGLAAATAQAGSPKTAYEARMQARPDTVQYRCVLGDDADGARLRIRLEQRDVALLQSIHPPADVAHAHAQLLAAAQALLASSRRALPSYVRLAALRRRAQADGVVSATEQHRLQDEFTKIAMRTAPPRKVGAMLGAALREFRRRGYEVEPKGPPKPVYERRVQALVDAAGKPRFSAAGTAAELRSELLRQASAAAGPALALGDITPAEPVAYAQQKLTAGLCERVRLLRGFAATLLKRHDATGVRAVRLNARDVDELAGRLYEAAFDDYRAAGYRIRPPR